LTINTKKSKLNYLNLKTLFIYPI